MVRRTDRPLLLVRVSFEVTRFSQRHLIEAYARLVPTPRRKSLRPTCDGARQAKPQLTAQAGSGGRP
jgi:hypothetical protein